MATYHTQSYEISELPPKIRAPTMQGRGRDEDCSSPTGSPEAVARPPVG
jgi:hypothetical protein